jgi:hypothetical protein
MTNRSGSFPLMNLAADFGVDYGDVLLAAEASRMSLSGDGTLGRMRLAQAATTRLHHDLTRWDAMIFWERLTAMVSVRWGQ